MSTPTSQIYICSGVRLTNRYDHTLYFENINDQKTYFMSKKVKSFVAYTYLRKSWSIKVNDTMGNAIKWSYLFFTNPDDQKTYYYFINDVQYINDGTVELTLELDVIQTYLFDFYLLPCFIDREHSATDNVGDNIVEENLDTGEFVTVRETTVDISELVVVIQTTVNLRLVELLSASASKDDIETAYDVTYYSKFGGVFGACTYFASEVRDMKKLGQLLRMIDGHGKIDCVMNMFMYPKELLVYEYSSDYASHQITDIKTFEHSITMYDTPFKFTPRNNKLKQYPYNVFTINNNYGASAIYRPEFFGNHGEAYFKIVGCLSPDGSVKAYPLNYKGMQHNYEEGVTMGNYPLCAWNSDPYKLWVAQNQNQQNLGYITGAGSILVGLGMTVLSKGSMAKVGVPMAIGGAMSITNQLAQNKDRDVQPPQARGIQSTSVNVTNGFQTFTICHKAITDEYAKMIDDYFTMYGYKVSKVKVPNIHVRENFTYTKTIGCSCHGLVPQNDLVKIGEIFDNGITFWTDPTMIGDYSVSNNTL